MVTHIAILVEVFLQNGGIVFEPKHLHCKEYIVAIDCLAILLLAFLSCYEKSRVRSHVKIMNMLVVVENWHIVFVMNTGLLTFTGNERDKLGYASLDNLFGILGDLCVFWQGLFHYPRHIGDGQQAILILGVFFRFVPGQVRLGHFQAVCVCAYVCVWCSWKSRKSEVLLKRFKK